MDEALRKHLSERRLYNGHALGPLEIESVDAREGRRANTVSETSDTDGVDMSHEKDCETCMSYADCETPADVIFIWLADNGFEPAPATADYLYHHNPEIMAACERDTGVSMMQRADGAYILNWNRQPGMMES